MPGIPLMTVINKVASSLVFCVGPIILNGHNLAFLYTEAARKPHQEAARCKEVDSIRSHFERFLHCDSYNYSGLCRTHMMSC